LFLVFLLIISYSQTLQAHGDGEETISPERLNSSLGEIKILDIRSEKDYEQEHIETALVLPLKEISEARLTRLGLQGTDPIVVYADSDIPAKKAKVLLEVMGFASVKILKGGLVHWKEDGFQTDAGKMEMAGESEEQEKISSISVHPAEYDFGIITKEKGVVNTIFSLSNTGNENVMIEEISTSCGCTSAKVSENTIAPGKTISLDVFFDPNFHKEPQGRFSRTVFLQTSEGMELQAKIYVHIED
jgi:rhodanese-related sulfurtransferase